MTARVPQIDLAAVLKDPNPHIDLKTNSYEKLTRNFLKALTTWKNRSMTTISDRRKAQAMEKKKMVDKTHQVENEINNCKVREIDLVAGKHRSGMRSVSLLTSIELEREKEERQEIELAVAAFKRQLATLKDKCSSIDSEIEQYRAITESLRKGSSFIN